MSAPRLTALVVAAGVLLGCQGGPTVRGTNKGELRLSIEGDAQAPALELAFDLGAVPVGQRKEVVIRGANVGEDTLKVLGVSLGSAGNGSWFVRDTTRTLEPGASVTATVTFQPATAGAQATTVTFSHDADAQLPVVNLTGTGT